MEMFFNLDCVGSIIYMYVYTHAHTHTPKFTELDT